MNFPATVGLHNSLKLSVTTLEYGVRDARLLDGFSTCAYRVSYNHLAPHLVIINAWLYCQLKCQSYLVPEHLYTAPRRFLLLRMPPDIRSFFGGKGGPVHSSPANKSVRRRKVQFSCEQRFRNTSNHTLQLDLTFLRTGHKQVPEHILNNGYFLVLSVNLVRTWCSHGLRLPKNRSPRVVVCLLHRNTTSNRAENCRKTKGSE